MAVHVVPAISLCHLQIHAAERASPSSQRTQGRKSPGTEPSVPQPQAGPPCFTQASPRVLCVLCTHACPSLTHLCILLLLPQTRTCPGGRFRRALGGGHSPVGQQETVNTVSQKWLCPIAHACGDSSLHVVEGTCALLSTLVSPFQPLQPQHVWGATGAGCVGLINGLSFSHQISKAIENEGGKAMRTVRHGGLRL